MANQKSVQYVTGKLTLSWAGDNIIHNNGEQSELAVESSRLFSGRCDTCTDTRAAKAPAHTNTQSTRRAQLAASELLFLFFFSLLFFSSPRLILSFLLFSARAHCKRRFSYFFFFKSLSHSTHTRTTQNVIRKENTMHSELLVDGFLGFDRFAHFSLVVTSGRN